MSSRKKTKRSLEDMISHLPDSLIHEILGRLSIKDIVRTSVLSKSWKNHWLSVPRLDLDTNTFRDSDAFRCFGERVLYSNKESWITKLRLCMHRYDYRCLVTSWIDSVVKRRIQYLDVVIGCLDARMPLSIYTSETLVHLKLGYNILPKAEFVFLPCLKLMHLNNNTFPNEATLEKLILGSPVLEDLLVKVCCEDYPLDSKVVQMRSRTLKKVYIDTFDVVIDAPLLECFGTSIFSKKKYKFVDLGFSTRLDLNISSLEMHSESFIRDILADISKVRDLTINNAIWKDILLYSESRPLLQFQHLTRLNAKFTNYDLETLPTILESCPILESLTLELVRSFHWHGGPRRGPPNAMITTVVPQCFVSSLKFVDLIKSVEKKRSISRYKGEIELVRYFLEDSTSLEKLKLNISLTKKVKCDFLKELREMQVCSSGCEVVVV